MAHGMHGNVSTNIAIEETDLVICIGARFTPHNRKHQRILP